MGNKLNKSKVVFIILGIILSVSVLWWFLTFRRGETSSKGNVSSKIDNNGSQTKGAENGQAQAGEYKNTEFGFSF